MQSMFTKKRCLLVILFLSSILFVLKAIAPVKFISISNKFILVEIAKTPHQRAQGLKGRPHLEKNRGMLFVFDKQGYHTFWMKETFIPLDIAFIDKRKRIVDIQQMIPLQTDTRYVPSQESIYALEMNAGWFEEHNIKTGDKLFFW